MTHYDREPVPGDVLVQLSFPYSNIDGRYVSLAITDRTSGLPLVEVPMTAEQFMDVMSHTATRVSGATLPARPERIGKRMVVDTTSLGRSPERTPEQVRDAYLADGWDVADVRRTNFGHQVVARRWIDPSTQEG